MLADSLYDVMGSDTPFPQCRYFLVSSHPVPQACCQMWVGVALLFFSSYVPKAIPVGWSSSKTDLDDGFGAKGDLTKTFFSWIHALIAVLRTGQCITIDWPFSVYQNLKLYNFVSKKITFPYQNQKKSIRLYWQLIENLLVLTIKILTNSTRTHVRHVFSQMVFCKFGCF